MPWGLDQRAHSPSPARLGRWRRIRGLLRRRPRALGSDRRGRVAGAGCALAPGVTSGRSRNAYELLDLRRRTTSARPSFHVLPTWAFVLRSHRPWLPSPGLARRRGAARGCSGSRWLLRAGLEATDALVSCTPRGGDARRLSGATTPRGLAELDRRRGADHRACVVCWALDRPSDMQSSASSEDAQARRSRGSASSRAPLTSLLEGAGSGLVGVLPRDGLLGGSLLRRWTPRPEPPGVSSAGASAASSVVSSAGASSAGSSAFGAGGLLGRRLLGRLGGLRLVGLGHQLDHRHRGVVALARADLGDPGVAARALGERSARSR